MTQVTAEKSYLHRPKAIGITVRWLKFNPHAIRRHYFANSPVMSHLLTALSSTFPIGEQFFVHSVRNVRDQVQDPQLQAQIAAFIGQEAMHSKAHREFNNAWRRDDYQLDRFQAWLARKDHHVKSLPPKVQLAITCAFEHFTAPHSCFCRIRKTVCRKSAVICLACICWRKCCCSYCRNICLITGKIFIRPKSITVAALDTGNSAWQRSIRLKVSSRNNSHNYSVNSNRC